MRKHEKRLLKIVLTVMLVLVAGMTPVRASETPETSISISVLPSVEEGGREDRNASQSLSEPETATETNGMVKFTTTLETAGNGQENGREEETETVNENPESIEAEVKENAKVFSEPDKASAELGVVYAGEIVYQISRSGDWSQVVWFGGLGFVPTAILDLHGEIPDEGNTGNGLLVAIDAGHQAYANIGEEPIGPGSSETKMKVTDGTAGDYTGASECQLNLTVALKLEEELLERGYDVLMIRRSNDVNISNVERATMVNDAEADAYIRLHADSSDDRSVHGCMMICQTPGNPWNGYLYPECRRLSEAVLRNILDCTGASNRGIMESDAYSGTNWCEVPVTLVEMGLMSNEEEDCLLQTDSYQDKIVEGIANGLDEFFAGEQTNQQEKEEEP